ncbi:hypothetical protein NL50_10605 [Clostridium acetobutylicum]|nr:hypothetical protein NL50_10605 [Clostridium acetobutylicum]
MKNKHFFKKTIALLSIFTIVFTSNVLAAENNSPNSKAEQAAKTLLVRSKINKTFVNEINLYDPNDKENGILLSLKNGGYIIVNLDDYSIPEYSFVSNNKFITDSNKKYIYLGPLNYYEKKNGTITEAKTKKIIKNIPKLKNDYLDIKNTMKLNKKTNSTYNFTDGTLISHRVNTLYEVPNYSYNPNGICGSTAAAMMLRHFQLNYMNDSIPSNLITSDGITLIKSLVPYIQLDGAAALDPNHNSLGSNMDSTVSGLNQYISLYDSKDSSHIKISDVTNDQIEALAFSNDLVDLNYSFVLAIYDPSKYGNHAVTGYGYIQDGNTVPYEIVNDGWGSTDVHISSSVVSGITYMVKQ